MENEIYSYYPSFKNDFIFKGPQFSIKTKPKGDDDDRSCYIYLKDRLISVLSGKIDNIFFATEEVIKLLK